MGIMSRYRKIPFNNPMAHIFTIALVVVLVLVPGQLTKYVFAATFNLLNTNVEVYPNAPQSLSFTVPSGSSAWLYGNLVVYGGLLSDAYITISDQSAGTTLVNEGISKSINIGMPVNPGDSYIIILRNPGLLSFEGRSIQVLLNADVNVATGNMTTGGNMTVQPSGNMTAGNMTSTVKITTVPMNANIGEPTYSQCKATFNMNPKATSDTCLDLLGQNIEGAIKAGM